MPPHWNPVSPFCPAPVVVSIPEPFRSGSGGAGAAFSWLEGPDFDFRLSRRYPVRELIPSGGKPTWNSSNAFFLRWVSVSPGDEWRYWAGCDAVWWQQLHYLFNGVLPYHEPSGLYDVPNSAAGACVPGIILSRVRSYPWLQSSRSVRAHGYCGFGRSPAITTGEHYRYAEPYREAETTPPPIRKPKAEPSTLDSIWTWAE